MTTMSQQDPRWSSLQLGTSQSSIGSKGCTITSLASILNTTPDIVNTRLNAVGGFKDGNLLIWAKIAEAFPGVTCQRLWSYNNEDVLANVPCIVQVDGSPIGAPTHFVVYIGAGQMMDPWTGTIESTSKYTPVSYAIVKGSWQQVQEGHIYKGYELTNLESMRVAIDVLVRVQSGELVDKAQFEKQSEATTQCQIQLQTALDMVSVYQAEAEEYKKKADEFVKKYETELQENKEINATLETYAGTRKNYGQEALDAQHLAKDRGDFLHMIGDELQVQYDPTNDKALVEEVLQRVSDLQSQQSEQNPQAGQLQGILRGLIAMNANVYLASRGVAPIDSDRFDPQVVEKVKLYLEDLANELITLSTNSTSPVRSSPVAKTFKPKRKFKNIFQPIFNLFIES